MRSLRCLCIILCFYIRIINIVSCDSVMAEYKLRLLEWGLHSYVSIFEDEGINDESFILLDQVTIEKLFNKCGPRLTFQKKFNEYLETIKGNNLEKNSLDSVSSQDETFELASSAASSSNKSDILIFEPDEITQNLIRSLEEITPKRVLENPQEASTSFKKNKQDSIFPQGLLALLDRYPDGKIILSHKYKLTNDHRQKLVKIIINELFSTIGTELRASTFLRVCEEIESIFPNEKSHTYYIPYVPRANSAKGYGPKGKLWSRYANVRAALRQANSFKVSKSVHTNQVSSPEKNELEENQLQFLRVACEPYPKLLECWEGTHRLRRKLYLNLDAAKYFDDFPCLKINTGIELIETDFNQRFPEHIDTVYRNWPKISDAIIKELHERKINDGAEYKDTSLHALMMLPFLFSPVTLKRNRKGENWRPTRSEIQESFFFNVKDFGELEERISQRRDRLYKYGLPMQPSVCVVGELNEPSYYIIVNDIKYKTDTSIRALELTFKLFHAIDLDWPLESEHIWLFIQQLVFEIKSNKRSPATETVISDIRYQIQN